VARPTIPLSPQILPANRADRDSGKSKSAGLFRPA
jgi:hypothetical protein